MDTGSTIAITSSSKSKHGQEDREAKDYFQATIQALKESQWWEPYGPGKEPLTSQDRMQIAKSYRVCMHYHDVTAL